MKRNSGATKLLKFLHSVVGKNGTFMTKFLYRYVSLFGLKQSSLSGTLNNLKKKGLLKNYAVSGQRGKVWIVV